MPMWVARCDFGQLQGPGGGGGGLVGLCVTVTDRVSVGSCIVKRVVGVLCRGTFI